MRNSNLIPLSQTPLHVVEEALPLFHFKAKTNDTLLKPSDPLATFQSK
jgi:hypothetical protein